VTRPRRLDSIDARIIEALQTNGRESFRRIAAELGISEATVRARYVRLCRDDIVQVTAVTNPLGLGFDAMAMVGIRTAGPPERVADQIARWDEARRHLLELTNRIRAVDGVLSTESFLYLELWKQLYDWGTRSPAGVTTEVGVDG
jgi:Lrp/AsnC family transcriptional regulator for asnA, asnC and gidA